MTAKTGNSYRGCQGYRGYGDTVHQAVMQRVRVSLTTCHNWITAYSVRANQAQASLPRLTVRLWS